MKKDLASYTSKKNDKESLEKAYYWIHKAMEKGCVCTEEYCLILTKKATPESFVELYHYVSNRENKYDYCAIAWLGRLYRDGKGVDKNIHVTITKMKSAFRKYPPIRLELLKLLCDQDTENSRKEIARYLPFFIKTKDSHALAFIGKMYRDGIGVKQDLDAAKEWFEKAAQENPIWYYDYCELLIKSNDEDSKKKAFEIYSSLATKGETRAMIILSRVYREGNGVETDLKKSYYWLSKSRKNKDFF